MRILVLGGSGFVGQEICLEALKRGWTVASLSRSGPPSSPLTPQLLSKVNWHRGSAIDPASYHPAGRSILKDVNYLVHSIGILVPDAQRSYHDVSVEPLRTALAKPNSLKGVGYVSAASYGSAFKSVMSGYYAGKNEAEQFLCEAQAQGSIPSVCIVRPGLMWGEGRLLSKPISVFYSIGTFFAGGLFPRALAVSSVAKSLLDSLERNQNKTEILEVSDMIKS